MMHQQQQFVAVPYVGLVPRGIGGRQPRVTVVGSVPPTAVRFSVNLQCGPNTHPLRDDIALHMQFRFDGSVPYVARNHLQSQVWGAEESHGYLSFGRGHQFELHVDTEHDHFKIHFNNLHFTDFRHRIPPQRIADLTIDGDVIVSAILFDGQPARTTIPGLGMMPAPMAYNQPMGMPMAHGMAAQPLHPAMAPYGIGPTMASYPGSGSHHATSHAIPVIAGGVGTGLVAGALMHGANKKMMKKQKKAMKKAMKPHKFKHKHLHHGMHGFHHKKGSSSSSSSSSEEE